MWVRALEAGISDKSEWQKVTTSRRALVVNIENGSAVKSFANLGCRHVSILRTI